MNVCMPGLTVGSQNEWKAAWDGSPSKGSQVKMLRRDGNGSVVHKKSKGETVAKYVDVLIRSTRAGHVVPRPDAALQYDLRCRRRNHHHTATSMIKKITLLYSTIRSSPRPPPQGTTWPSPW